MSSRDKTDSRDTIVAQATAAGRAGVGIIRLSGPLAGTIAETICKRTIPSREIAFARFYDRQDDVIDHGVCLFFASPQSYTGEDTIEFQTHGSSIVLQMLSRRCIELGARQAKAGEFTERAFINGKIDLYQAEAVADLIEAGSERSVKSAMRSLQGLFSEQVQQLLQEVISVRMYVESALDFPEEEIDFLADEKIQKRIETCLATTAATLTSAKQGKVINEGISIAIVGKPNVGKSSLMNALMEEDAAIVTNIPGTTRDRIEHDIMLEGVKIRLIDTAGLRDTDDLIEQEGIKRSREALQSADWIFYLLSGPEAIDEDMVSSFQDADNVFIIRNKSDIFDLEESLQELPDHIELQLSVKTGAGMELLKQTMVKTLGLSDLSENTFSARQRHINALIKTHEHINQALQQLRHQAEGEFIAQELRWAQDNLSELTGDYHNDDLLGEIFSRFCIGK